jgi:hypothetical protein
MLCFEILNRYIKHWYESPVAKNLKVTASRSLTVTDFFVIRVLSGHFGPSNGHQQFKI